jgi:hypothetical protein
MGVDSTAVLRKVLSSDSLAPLTEGLSPNEYDVACGMSCFLLDKNYDKNAIS